MIEEEIVATLRTGVPLVDNRVYPLTMPQDTKRDCLTFQVVSNMEDLCVEGNVYANSIHIQIDVWSKSYMDSIKIRDEVLAAMHGEFVLNGVFYMDLYEPHTLKYRQLCDMIISK